MPHVEPQATLVPRAAIDPGRADATRLLVLWFLRRGAVILVWAGVGVAVLVRPQQAVDAGLGSPGEVWDNLLSPSAGIVAGILLRVLVNGVALLAAWPLARSYERRLPPRTYVGAAVGIVFDRFRVMRGLRALRWTHDVRQLALAALERPWLRRLDPVLDVVGVVAAGAAICLIVLDAS
jgi:hypothetical protein